MSLVGRIKELVSKKFIQDVSILQVGSMFSFACSALASIFFARMLGSESYGLYSLTFTLFSLITAFTNIGSSYTVLTLLPAAYAQKNKPEATHLISFFVYINLFISIALGLIAFAFAPFLAKLIYHQTEVGYLSRYLIITLVSGIFFSLLTIVLQSVRQIKNLTVWENVNKILYLIIALVLVIFGFSVFGIVLGYFISSVVVCVMSIFYLKQLSDHNDLLPSWREIFLDLGQINFKKYLKFGILIAIDKNLNSLYSILPVAFLGVLAVSNSQLAYFKIALSYWAFPAIFMTAIARLLMVQLPKSLVAGQEVFKSHFRNTSLISGFLFILIMIPFFVLAPWLVQLLYGREYSLVVKLIYVTSLGYISFGFGIGYSSFFRTLNKLKSFIKIDLATVILGSLLFFVATKFFTPLESAIITLIFFNTGVNIIQGALVVKYYRELK